jgi:hypothetical protein
MAAMSAAFAGVDTAVARVLAKVARTRVDENSAGTQST